MGRLPRAGEDGSDRPSLAMVESNRARAVEISKELTPVLRLMIERRISPWLKSRISVDDVLQGAFIRLSDSLASRSPGSDEALRAWVFRSVLNEWHDQRRWNEAQRRNVRGEEPLPDGTVMLLLAGMGVSTNCGIKESVERIRSAVTKEAFEIVWLHAVDELSHGKIAEIVGKSEDAVGRCYLRALEKIRKAVASPFDSSSP